MRGGTNIFESHNAFFTKHHTLKLLKMWLLKIIEYLKDPHLVANIQEFFEVQINYNTKYSKKYRLSDNTESNGYNTVEKISNGHIKTDVSLYKEGSLPKEHIQGLDGPTYTINNRFWYYLFLFGTELGDEIFYSSFIPFWFWNIDGAVGRRVVLVWAIVMSIGQALKDVICWPRPACPPVVRLQSKWSQEYGMPSTHAMIGVSIPFSVLIFTMNRYIYPFPIGFMIAFCWCTLICMSRLYLGMHTVLDIVAGLLLAILLMIPLIPLVDTLDYYILTNVWVLALLIAISIATVIYYPCSDKWTPTRGDTTMVVSVTAGVHAGAWLNYRTGALSLPSLSPPYNIIWPSYPMLGHVVLRTVLGFCGVIGTKALCKFLCYTIMCAILKVNSKELMKSVNTVYLLPNVFTIISIERPTFYTEM
ncbi:hypothetical protein KPH14_008467 [Odynerus spinipes]|uniref:Phosphatidic acid phosphatase type 2/haloperoxidase domain-containing protein n=1 Tax=Odynerus spinipes TaxID=1348599 RepID=A0AAD9REN3_9HYME|nr:hypothetical protein KPH14_008467 [Odynerus spinipes]